MTVLVATGSEVLRFDERSGTLSVSSGLEDLHPTCLAADPRDPARAWCGTHRSGVLRSEDAGRSWEPAGLEDLRVTALCVSPARAGLLWAGTEPSAVWRSDDGGGSWARSPGLDSLPSASEWSFPPRPDTHHVRWIAAHPTDAGRLWVAIEAGALVTTSDGGRSWHDCVEGGPFDTHELAVHADAPDKLRVSAGDGYFESADGGRSWISPERGLEVTYLRSVAIDPGGPEVVVVSASSHAHSAYMSGRSDGRLFRREGSNPWTRVREGWPEPPDTIAPLLASGARAGELWAADERGLHRSSDGGRTWTRVCSFEPGPSNLRGLVRLS